MLSAKFSQAKQPADLYDLMRNCAVGDKDSFTLLYKTVRPGIINFLRQRGLQYSDAEDLFQRTMVSVWQHASSYDPNISKPFTWITTIAYRKLVDAKKHTKRKGDLSLEMDIACPPLESELEAQELEATVKRAVEGLKPHHQEIITLAVADIPYKDIASFLRTSIGTVKSRLHQARQCLLKNASLQKAVGLSLD